MVSASYLRSTAVECQCRTRIRPTPIPGTRLGADPRSWHRSQASPGRPSGAQSPPSRPQIEGLVRLGGAARREFEEGCGRALPAAEQAGARPPELHRHRLSVPRGLRSAEVLSHRKRVRSSWVSRPLAQPCYQAPHPSWFRPPPESPAVRLGTPRVSCAASRTSGFTDSRQNPCKQWRVRTERATLGTACDENSSKRDATRLILGVGRGTGLLGAQIYRRGAKAGRMVSSSRVAEETSCL